MLLDTLNKLLEGGASTLRISQVIKDTSSSRAKLRNVIKTLIQDCIPGHPSIVIATPRGAATTYLITNNGVNLSIDLELRDGTLYLGPSGSLFEVGSLNDEVIKKACETITSIYEEELQRLKLDLIIGKALSRLNVTAYRPLLISNADFTRSGYFNALRDLLGSFEVIVRTLCSPLIEVRSDSSDILDIFREAMKDLPGYSEEANSLVVTPASCTDLDKISSLITSFIDNLNIKKLYEIVLNKYKEYQQVN